MAVSPFFVSDEWAVTSNLYFVLAFKSLTTMLVDPALVTISSHLISSSIVAQYLISNFKSLFDAPPVIEGVSHFTSTLEDSRFSTLVNLISRGLLGKALRKRINDYFFERLFNFELEYTISFHFKCHIFSQKIYDQVYKWN